MTYLVPVLMPTTLAATGACGEAANNIGTTRSFSSSHGLNARIARRELQSSHIERPLCAAANPEHLDVPSHSGTSIW
jgi:hypothetical protein